ncbi:QRFP-like peptide receptor [Babylonia areolata]|uniref:QRFP-like peptide receptor n=1 Tax=Babylonia areolata TaxID=304850 RepID=UPI003FD4F0DC
MSTFDVFSFGSNNDSWNETAAGPLLAGDGGDPPSWPAYQPIYITVLNAVVFCTGTMGNVLVIVVVVLVRDMRTPMNWYLVNLSVADLLVLLVCQPAALTEFFARDRWFLGAGLCKMVPFLEHTVLHASTLIIVAITVERYYAICQPLKKLAMLHKPRPLRVLPCLWGVASLTAVPFVIMTNLQHTLFFDGTPCEVCATSVREKWHFSYVIGMFVVFFALPMLLLLWLYVCIIRRLRSPDSAIRFGQAQGVAGMSTQRTRKNVVKMLVGIVVLFFVSLMPVRCVIIWQIFTPDVQIQGMGPERYYNLMWITRLLMYVNSAGNPIIYSLISSKFQEAFWRLLTGRRNISLDRASRSSASRLSLNEIHRGSWLSPKLPSHVRLATLPALNARRCCATGRRASRAPALRRHRTISLSAWIASQDSPGSSPLMVRSCSSPFVKQRSCTSML